MPKPLLHTATNKKLDALLKNPPHALLLSGPAGIGKGSIAQWLGGSILHITGSLQDYPYALQIEPIGAKAIGIEVVRQLEHIISLKIPSKQAIARLVIIYDAHLLTGEAQNALLKTLEEPPADTMLILTTSQSEALLPTIRSRLQTIEIIRPPKTELETLLIAEGVPKNGVAQLFALSGGLPGLALALARGDTAHPLVEAAQTARELLQQPTFERLTKIETLVKNRELAVHTVYILVQMSHAALLTGRGTERWQKVHAAAFTAEKLLSQNVQPKLVLTNLMLNL